MATAYTGAISRATRPTFLARFLAKYFYFAMSFFILVLVTGMFSTTVPDRLFHPKVEPPSIIWFHGAVFYGWVLFFIVQTGLARLHKVRWHRTLGWFGLALGIAVFTLGVSTTIAMHHFEFNTLHQGNFALLSISVPLFDMLCFAPVFTLAIVFRKKLEYHRRLMYIASCILTAAAWGRIPESILPGFWFYAGVDLLILLGATRDLIVNRAVHRVYMLALPLLAAGQFVIAQISFSAWWLRTAKAILL
jgi:hypothetical protein